MWLRQVGTSEAGWGLLTGYSLSLDVLISETEIRILKRCHEAQMGSYIRSLRGLRKCEFLLGCSAGLAGEELA